MNTILTFDEDGSLISKDEVTGTGSSVEGSWEKVARALVLAGWGSLSHKEYCRQLVVGPNGIRMILDNKAS